MKKTKLNSGVSLTILVIVVIVLIILAGISLNGVIGTNGSINRGKEASIQAQVQKVAEDAKMAYRDVYEERDEVEGIGIAITTVDVTSKMIEKYRI